MTQLPQIHRHHPTREMAGSSDLSFRGRMVFPNVPASEILPIFERERVLQVCGNHDSILRGNVLNFDYSPLPDFERSTERDKLFYNDIGSCQCYRQGNI